MKIAFSPPDLTEADVAAVTSVLRSGWITTGPVAREFESALAEFCGVGEVVTLNSCTAALELALRIMDIGPGDEVIVPAYTYTASAAVVTHVGAELVLVDNAQGAFLPDVGRIIAAVTPRTKAIIVVDLAGVPFPTEELRAALDSSCRMPAPGLLPSVERPVVIVDGAHSLGAERGGRRAGTLGDLTAFSFHAVKNLTTGEGGALTWRSHDGADLEAVSRRARRLALHGQTKDALAKTKAGQWEYDIDEPGYKSNMPDILAALGLSQLGRYEDALQRRRTVAEEYGRLLGDIVDVLPHATSDYLSSAHLALVGLRESAARRPLIIERMSEMGIATNVHYKPLPLLKAYKRLGFDIKDFPNAHSAYLGELTLPLHTLLTDEDVSRIAGSLRQALVNP